MNTMLSPLQGIAFVINAVVVIFTLAVMIVELTDGGWKLAYWMLLATIISLINVLALIMK